MENQSLKKRLYQNLSQKPIKTTFLLESDPKSPSAILKPRIFQETVPEPQKSPIILLNKGKSLISNEKKTKEVTKKKAVAKPQEVPLDKLSKEAKSILEDRKIKIKNNLKPHEIFSFYDAFPEMIEDFFYLNRLSHPYDYQIVSYAKRNPTEYMTISSQGVTLYHDKEAEFLTRKQWLDDEKIYYKLQKIDFFNQYKLSKNFSIWKNKMKLHYMKQMSSILNQKLFLTSDHPRHCLKQVRRSVLILEDSLSYLPMDNHEPLSWKQFLTLSKNYQQNGLINKIKQVEKEIVKDLVVAIDKQIKNFKENNKIKIEGLNSNKEENKQGYVYSQQAILRKQYKRVLKLIKLGEGILLESKIELISRWMKQIIEKLKGISDDGFRQQWITITFQALPPEKGSSIIQWDPTYEQFISTFQTIIKQAVDIICSHHQGILLNSAFEKYRNSDEQFMISKEDKYNSLKSLIEDSQFYKDLMEEIEICLQKEYESVKKQQESLRKFIEIYAKHKNLKRMEDIVAESSAADISQYVREWKQENQQMQDLPDDTQGMIKFDYSIMRKTIMGVAQESLSALFYLIPLRLSDICHSTQKSAKVLLESINMIPNENNFVQFQKAVRNANENLTTILTKRDEMKQIYMILEENRRPNLEIHKTNIKQAIGAISELNTKVDQAQAKFDYRRSKFNKDIDEKIVKLKVSIQDNMQRLQQIQSEQSQNDIEGLLYKINAKLPSILEIQTQVNKIQQIQQQLGLNVTDFSYARILFEKVQEMNQLWTCKKEWKQLVNSLQKQHYTKVDCELISTKWSQFSTKIDNLRQKVQDNDYLNKLVTDISDFQNLIELIKALQSKNLDEKAWKQISEYLAYEIQKIQENPNDYPFSNWNDPIYTVQWLIQNQIDLYKQKIEFIVKKSEKQSVLVNNHYVMKSYINNLSLEFVSKKRELIVLGKNENVFKQLRDHLDILLKVFNHEYSQSTKKDVKLLAKHYEYVLEILEYANEFAQNWEKYEDLFDSSRPYIKQLNKESKDFSNWENAWKKIIKNIMADGWSKRVYEENLGVTPSRTTIKAINKANSNWDSIKKGVQDFLDRRRNLFYHYFYLTDDQLLRLLKMYEHNPHQISPAIIPVVYQYIRQIKIGSKTSEQLVSVISKDGEELIVGKSITCKATSQCQQILRGYEQNWKKSLVSTIKKALNDYISMQDEQTSRRKIIMENVTQVVLAFHQIIWVKLAEETYLCPQPIGSLQNWVQIQNGQIRDLYQLLGQKMEKCQKKKVEQILLQSVYLRDKTQHFIHTKTNSLASYEWERIIKLCDGTGNMHEKLYLKAAGAQIFYGGQFFGGQMRQCITPETERSHLNLIMSIHDHQVSIFQEGHQETLRQLSFYTAHSFKVFNFNDNSANKILSRVLAGACSQGSWACLKVPSSYQFLSILANQLSQIQQNILILENANSIQLGKYNINLNQHMIPSFFLIQPKNLQQFYHKIPHKNYRNISLCHPNIKKILTVVSETLDHNTEIGEVVWIMIESCQKMFKQKNYKNFDLKYGLKIMEEFRQIEKGPKKELKKTIIQIFIKNLEPHLLPADQILLKQFIESYDFNPIKKSQIRAKKTLIVHQPKINEDLEAHLQKINPYYGPSIKKDAHVLINCIQDPANNHKKIVLIGDNLSGKSEVIKIAQGFISGQRNQKIQVERIYPSAFRKKQILGCEGQVGIIAKIISSSPTQKWLVFDGPITLELQTILEQLDNKAILNSFGVFDFHHPQNRIRVIQESPNLSSVSPPFVLDNCVVYMERSQNRVSEIISAMIKGIASSICEQRNRTQTKNDETSIQIKYFEKKQKSLQLSNDFIELLQTNLVSLIQKVAPQRIVKIKSVDLLYQLSDLQLTHKCCKLIESVLKMNWDTIKEKDKNHKKVIQKLVSKLSIWTVFWSLSGLVNPEDISKFEKNLLETLKIQGFQDLSQNVIFPGTGLQLSSIRSQKAQSALSNIPGRGVPTNLLTQYWIIFQSGNSLKNKFYEEIYLDQPHSIRVNTDESTLFSYISFLISHSNTQVALCGPPGSGKKSIVELFNKNNQDKYESYSLRTKWYDPYFISTQISKPFGKISYGNKIYYKPTEISKAIHISIEDVSMIPQAQPTSEFLRMFLTEKGFWNHKGEWTTFRQSLVSLIISQISNQNKQRVSFNRLLSKLFLLQVGKISKEKLISIYGPIVETWGSSTWQDPDCEDARVFTSRNGDSLIDATTNIFEKASQIAQSYDCSNFESRNKRLMFLPKIQDICGVIINIFQSQDPCNISAQYFSQLWGHQVIRVFCDKLKNSNDREQIVKQIKKQSLLKFKENFSMDSPHFIFTSFGEEEGSYSKCQTINNIYQLLEQKAIPGSLPILFDQMVEELIKFYRILTIESGHALIATPSIRSVRKLWKLVCFMQDAIFHEIEGGKISFQTHMFPTVLNQANTCLFIDSEQADYESLYLTSCLLNRNNYYFDISPENFDRIKNKMIKIAQETINRQLQSAQGSSPNSKNKPFNISQLMNTSIEALKLSEMTNKIDHYLHSLISQEFSQHSHFVYALNPVKQSSTRFLHNNMSIIKHMQIIWHQFEESTITMVSENMMKQNFCKEYPEKRHVYQGFNAKCRKIYDSMDEKLRNRTDFVNFLSSSAKFFYILDEKLQEQLGEAQQCLKKMNQNNEFLQKCKQKGQILQSDLQKLVKKQDELNQEMQQAMEKQTNQQNFQQQMKQIKYQKEQLQQNSRQVRTSQKIYEDLIQLFPTLQKTKEIIQAKQKDIKTSTEDAIIVQAALLYLNSITKEDQYLNEINKWRDTFNKEKFKNIEEILQFYERICGKDYVRVPQWHNFSPFSQLKGIHFLYNCLSLSQDASDSAFGNQFLVINDQENILLSLLQNLPQKGSIYSQFRLISTLPKPTPKEEKNSRQNDGEKDKKDKSSKISQRNEIYGQMERQIQRSQTGLIAVDRNLYPWFSRSDLDTFNKILKQRKIEANSRIVLLGGSDPIFQISSQKQDLALKMREKSLVMEFGQSTLIEKRKSLISIRQITLKQDQYSQMMIKKSLVEGSEKTMQILGKIRSELNEIGRIKHRLTNILEEPRMTPTDQFLIKWILSFLPEQGNAKVNENTLEIYGCLKRYLMEINSSLQQKVCNIEQIEQDVRKQWQYLIKANILNGDGLDILQMIKFLMPLEGKHNVVFLQQFSHSEEFIRQKLGNQIYSLNFVQLQPIKNGGNNLNNESMNQSNAQLRKLYIFMGYSSQLKQVLMDFFIKYKQSSAPVFLVFGNFIKEEVQKDEDLNEEYRIICKQIPTLTINLLSDRNYVTQSELVTPEKKSIQSVKITEDEKQDTDEQKGITQKIKKILTLLMGQQVKKGSYPDLPFNFLINKSELLNESCDLKKWMKDFLPHQDCEIAQMILNALESSQKSLEDEQIQGLIDNYSQILQQYSISQIKKVSKPQQCLKNEQNLTFQFVLNPSIKKIEDMIECLPNSFNVSEFSQTNDIMSNYLIELANLSNEQRTFLKRYYQQKMKLLKGQKLDEYCDGKQFGIWLPIPQSTKKLVKNQHAIKKGLQYLGVLTATQSFSHNIRSTLTNSPQSVPNLAASSFKVDHPSLVSNKFLHMACLRACRKMKISYENLQIQWRLDENDQQIEQNILSQLCLVFQIANMKNKNIVMIPYDPKNTVQNAPQVPKNASKKQKLKRNKQQQAKPLPVWQDPSRQKKSLHLAKGEQIGIVYQKIRQPKSSKSIFEENKIIIS